MVYYYTAHSILYDYLKLKSQKLRRVYQTPRLHNLNLESHVNTFLSPAAVILAVLPFICLTALKCSASKELIIIINGVPID